MRGIHEFLGCCYADSEQDKADDDAEVKHDDRRMSSRHNQPWDVSRESMRYRSHSFQGRLKDVAGVLTLPLPLTKIELETMYSP